ncbi:MAG: YihA family ribosome biogenesis GTP-binding protein [Bacilli bacterium]|nr:YihA family ribosome biogenesis GTP-binding protein [Bacilli bacterium]
MEINTVELKSIAVRTSQYPEDNLPEFLLVGRSNVGKSSFINTLIERKNYAHTSSKPGKTTTLNFYEVNNKFYIVDVPGYGFAMGGKDKQKKFGMMIEEYLKTRESMKKVFLLVDYRHKPTEDDVLMYNFLKYYNIDVEVIATKYDKVNKNGRVKQDKLIRDTLKLPDDRPFIPFSTITKKGKDEVYKIIEESI